MAEPISESPEGETTEPLPEVAVKTDELGGPKLLGTASFFRLWLAQVVSSLGDWIGLFAILTLTARIGKGSPEAAIALVMSARMIPGFFLASVGGVLVDRWDRRRVMVTCDVGRGMVLATLPFVTSVWGLFLASLVLEVLTLLWSPAKEASVPNLVAADKLASANSFSLAAAYGTFPIASALFASLTKVAEILGRHADALHFLRLNQESLAIYFDVLTFFLSATLIWSLHLQRARQTERAPMDLTRTFGEIKEGWRFIGTNPTVRSVMVGLGTGLVGGAMIAPLGPIYANEVLQAGAAGFGLLLTALGMGVAVGVLALSAFQKRLSHSLIFPWAVVGAGASMLVAVTMSSLALTMLFIGLMGICAGAVYVLGFTILQETVEDEIRGRTFATLYTLSRLCMLISLSLAPLGSRLLDDVSNALVHGHLDLAGATLSVPGVRLTLWLGAVIILAAGGLALRAYRDAPRAPAR
ncbi:MAG: MFS transporter [Actinomycetota bacterium]|nr:MFS transporter [Actinomycetota bacterium]